MMGNDSLLMEALMPLLMAGGLAYYAYRVLFLHDLSSLKGRDNQRKKCKNEEKYARNAGKLMIFLAAACVAMSALMFVNTLAAFGELCISVVIFGILWKINHDKYGF